jgi:hypothetical protein
MDGMEAVWKRKWSDLEDNSGTVLRGELDFNDRAYAARHTWRRQIKT